MSGRGAATSGERPPAALAAWEWDLESGAIRWSADTLPIGPAESCATHEAFMACVHPEDRERVAAACRDAIARRGAYAVEFRYTRADGTTGRARSAGRVVAERPLRMLGVAADVDATQPDALARLAGGLAHDFNNLLTVLLGHSELLLRSLEPPLRDEAEAIRSAGERAAELTRQLLAFARRQILRPEWLDLNELAGSLAGSLGGAVELALAPHRVAVRADRRQLERALASLALRLGRPPSLAVAAEAVELDAVAVAARGLELAPGRYGRLSLRDPAAAPLDAATRALVFEPFGAPGSGLELASALGLVRQSGGDIACASTAGAGTSFDVYLPGDPD